MLSMWFGANVLGAIRESLGPPRIPGSGLLLCGENKGRNGNDAAYPSLESLYSVQVHYNSIEDRSKEMKF